MYCPILVRTTTLSVRTSINQSPLRRALLLALVAVALGSFTSSRTARAVSPAPDGGYPNDNTAEGTNALFSLKTGSFNAANGANALFSNTTGSFNTANGAGALFRNTSGIGNTANGVNALVSNTAGFFNTATGVNALFHNGLGQRNTASGVQALFSNTSGFGNTAAGYLSMSQNDSGFDNTAVGRQALENNTSGSFNIAVGNLAGHDLTTGTNNIDIGNRGVAGEAQTVRIGEQGTQTATFIAGIFGSTATGGVQVFINSNGQMGTVTSSARFKDDIKPMDTASEAILRLKPVTFHYKPELDPNGIPQFGLVAEEVEKVNPNLVVRDKDGKVNTVRYDAVNAMLLNEFLKEHRQVEEQKAGLAEMKSVVSKQEEIIANQQKQIEALTATVRKVSERVELGAPAVQMAANDD